MDEKYKELLKRLFELFKPLGYKKDGANFRLFQKNGIARIVNFQKSRYNTKDNLSFTINVGVYDCSKSDTLNLKFKEYDCYIRERPACVSSKYHKDIWWNITQQTDIDNLYQELIRFIENDVHSCLDKLEKRMKTAKLFAGLRK